MRPKLGHAASQQALPWPTRPTLSVVLNCRVLPSVYPLGQQVGARRRANAPYLGERHLLAEIAPIASFQLQGLEGKYPKS